MVPEVFEGSGSIFGSWNLRRFSARYSESFVGFGF